MKQLGYIPLQNVLVEIYVGGSHLQRSDMIKWIKKLMI